MEALGKLTRFCGEYNNLIAEVVGLLPDNCSDCTTRVLGIFRQNLLNTSRVLTICIISSLILLDCRPTNSNGFPSLEFIHKSKFHSDWHKSTTTSLFFVPLFPTVWMSLLFFLNYFYQSRFQH